MQWLTMYSLVGGQLLSESGVLIVKMHALVKVVLLRQIVRSEVDSDQRLIFQATSLIAAPLVSHV